MAKKQATIYDSEAIVKKMIGWAIFECKACQRCVELPQNGYGMITAPSLCLECGDKSFKIIGEVREETTIRTVQRGVCGIKDLESYKIDREKAIIKSKELEIKKEEMTNKDKKSLKRA